MFQLFKDALGWCVQLIADIISGTFHLLVDPFIGLMRSWSPTTGQYVDLGASALVPYMNAAEQWAPVSYILFLLQAFFVLAVAFMTYKAVMKVVPHFGA